MTCVGVSVSDILLISCLEVIDLEYSTFGLFQMFVAYILLNDVAASWILIIVYRICTTLISTSMSTLDITWRLIGMVVFLNFLCDASTSHESFIVLIFGITLVEVLSLEVLASTQRVTTLEMS